MDYFYIITTALQVICVLTLLVLHRLRAINNLRLKVGELTRDYAIKSFIDGSYGEASVAFEYFLETLPSTSKMFFSFKRIKLENWVEPAKLTLLLDVQKVIIKIS